MISLLFLFFKENLLKKIKGFFLSVDFFKKTLITSGGTRNINIVFCCAPHLMLLPPEEGDSLSGKVYFRFKGKANTLEEKFKLS